MKLKKYKWVIFLGIIIFLNIFIENFSLVLFVPYIFIIITEYYLWDKEFFKNDSSNNKEKK